MGKVCEKYDKLMIRRVKKPGKDGKGGYNFWAAPTGWSVEIKNGSLFFTYEIKMRHWRMAVCVDRIGGGTYDLAINILLLTRVLMLNQSASVRYA